MEHIYKHYPHLKTKNNLVYKSCQKEWMVVLSKLKDTKTNEDRDNLKDKNFAKFRADKLRTVLIFNKFNPSKTIDRIENSVYTDKQCEYKVGEIVLPDLYDEDINTVCGEGIHYYKTLEPAYYLELLDFVKNGEYKSWYDNGQLLLHCFYKDGKLEGEYKRWYHNGQINIECLHKNEELEGEYSVWYISGQIHYKYSYKDGKLEGENKYWYDNGQITKECFYKDGKLEGKQKLYFYNGQIYLESFYKDGLLDSKYKFWNYKGQLEEDCFYKDGIKL